MQRRTRLGSQCRHAWGFTVMELIVAISIIGILSAIGIVNFMRFKNRAGYASCVSNQRHTVEATVLYVSTVDPGTVTFDVNVLTAAGYLPKDAAECPVSTIVDFNDYTLDVVDNAVMAIACKVEPARHAWAVP